MINLLTLFLLSTTIQAKTIKIAVIDSGFNWQYSHLIKLCPDGHRNFTKEDDKDNFGHGTNVSGLIHSVAKDTDYCQMILKVFPRHDLENNLHYSIDAFKYAIEQKVDIINYSAGGDTFSQFEKDTIQKALDAKILVVVAAGNHNRNFDKNCNYYPACYDSRLIVVGNLRKETIKEEFFIHKYKNSNYGNIVDYWEFGTNERALGIEMTGSSQATAIISGKIVKQMRD